jgi:hypothetical protein
MKTLLSALVLTAASVLPVSAAGIHDFNPTNAAPSTTQARARAGQGQCVTTRDRSELCYIKTSANDFSIAIKDVNHPDQLEVAHINCSTGRWYSFGGLPKTTLNIYLKEFCPTFG